MKKIITVLFFAGFLTTAFAQDDRGDHYGNQYSENYQRDNRHGDIGYRHDDGRENWHRDYRGRDDQQYRDRDDRWRSENYYHDYYNHEMMENYVHRHYRNFPWIEIRLSRSDREFRHDRD